MGTHTTTRIVRTTLLGLAGLGAAAWLSSAVMAGGQEMGKPMMPHEMGMAGMSTMTREQKIANAMTAAPASVSANATVRDWPAKDGEPMAVLRAGSNGWSCLPDMPMSQGSDPMCIDQTWMQWMEAYMAHKTPQLTSAGIGYMMGPGGGWASNTDPHAMAATPDNQWHEAPPHLMILIPDLRSLAGISTDPKNGGPYVMFPGTPYAHIMAPTSASGMSMPSGR